MMFVFERQKRQVINIGQVEIEILKRHAQYLIYVTVDGIQRVLGHQKGHFWDEADVQPIISGEILQITQKKEAELQELRAFKWSQS